MPILLVLLRRETLGSAGNEIGESVQERDLRLILHSHRIDYRLHVLLHKKALVGEEIGKLELVGDGELGQVHGLPLILHSHQIDLHLYVLLRRETLGSAGDEIRQVLNERGRELAQLLKILRRRHLVPHHDLPLMILVFRRILQFHRKKEREQELVSVPEGDKQEVVNRPSPAAGRKRK